MSRLSPFFGSCLRRSRLVSTEAVRMKGAPAVFFSTSLPSEKRKDGFSAASRESKLGKKTDWKSAYNNFSNNVRVRQAAQMYENRQIAGPEEDRHRSQFPNWNYDAEVFAFGHRIGETFDDLLLRRALTDPSFVLKRTAKQEELGLGRDFEARHNQELSLAGEEIISKFVVTYIRTHFPNFPEEGCDAVLSYLLSEMVVAHVARNIGLTDLILCDRIQPQPQTLAFAFKAVVGALAESADERRAHEFVADFLLPQLVEKDVFELLDSSVTSFDLLQKIFTAHSGSVLEQRLIRSTASQTILASYTVGIYSDRTLVGEGSGETLPLAEDMAAKDALRRFFGTPWGAKLTFGSDARQLNLDFNRRNWRIADLL